ncbi:MAG: hypothetical protein KatS3mg076_1525 [Candidatus Binatia bacterium]|nr:MAG: hypothetical protein KatS3mg076_1525 [Candidatus Binatia bacterium]
MPGSNGQRTLLRVVAILVGLRAVTNFLKPFGWGSGIVILGNLIGGPAMYVLAPLVGLFMLVWAWTLWREHGLALPLGLAYLAFVAVNIVVFPLVEGLPGNVTPWMYGVYAVVALGVPGLGVWVLLSARRT